MSNAVTFQLSADPDPKFKRFEGLQKGETIVRIKKTKSAYFITVAKVKWSKYTIVNKLIRAWLKIKYI